MPEVCETAIAIDHDTGDVFNDTRSKAFEGMCRRAGLAPDGDPRRAPPVGFRATTAQVDVIVRARALRRRPPSPEAT